MLNIALICDEAPLILLYCRELTMLVTYLMFILEMKS
jgi:hypothetical protein